MQKHTRTMAVESTRSDILTTVFVALQNDSKGRFDTLEHPVTREVGFSIDILNVALLERLASHCGVTPGAFAAEVFEAALSEASDFFQDKVDGDLQEEAEAYAAAFKQMRVGRERLDAIVSGWKSLHIENREPY